MNDDYSSKTVLLAVVPKFPAVLSILGSGLILVYICKRRREGRTIQAYHRIMFSMSCADLVASSIYFAGTFPIPRGTVGVFGPVFWALGTPLSCRICGAWSQLQVLSPLYNGVLALYYLLVVKFQWAEQRVRTIEPYLHILPLLFALATSIAGAIMNIYGSVEWLCWIDSVKHDRYMKLRWTFLFAPVWVCWLLVSVVMFILYRSMRELEDKNHRYNTSGDNHHERSRQIAVQGMLYVLTFYITWFFPSIQRILELAGAPSNFVLQMLDTSLLPLQGLLNALVYARPRYLRLKKHYPDLGVCQLIWATYHHKEASSLSRLQSSKQAARTTSQPAIIDPAEGNGAEPGAHTTVVQRRSSQTLSPVVAAVP